MEAKDSYTEAHTERVATRARALGERVGLKGKELVDLYHGGMIHDIGKIGIPDTILLKPGPLDAAETAMMRRHPEIGEEIARPLRSAHNLLAIIRHHHESYDGTGYPDALAGDNIPLVARITAISDAYDAMISDRPYRAGMAVEPGCPDPQRGRKQPVGPCLVQIFLQDLAATRD